MFLLAEGTTSNFPSCSLSTPVRLTARYAGPAAGGFSTTGIFTSVTCGAEGGGGGGARPSPFLAPAPGAAVAPSVTAAPVVAAAVPGVVAVAGDGAVTAGACCPPAPPSLFFEHPARASADDRPSTTPNLTMTLLMRRTMLFPRPGVNRTPAPRRVLSFSPTVRRGAPPQGGSG
jgi:hypothetical protein